MTCLVSAAEAARDTGPLHDKADLEAARQYLTERLHEGKTVRRTNLRGLLHAELEGPRADFASIEIVNLLVADSDERAAKVDTFVEGVIERFLETNEDLVAETAAELAEEAPDA